MLQSRQNCSRNSLDIIRSAELGDLFSSKAFDYHWEQPNHTRQEDSRPSHTSSINDPLLRGRLYTAELKGHTGCVNAIEFANGPTKLFASGILVLLSHLLSIEFHLRNMRVIITCYLFRWRRSTRALVESKCSTLHSRRVLFPVRRTSSSTPEQYLCASIRSWEPQSFLWRKRRSTTGSQSFYVCIINIIIFSRE